MEPISDAPAPGGLRMLARFALTLWVLTGACVVLALVCHFLLGGRYPYDSPFVARVSRFDDLLDWLPQFHTLHAEAFFHQRLRVVYPAPMSVLYGIFALAGRWALAAYMLCAAAITGSAMTLTAGRLRQKGVAITRTFALLGTLLATSYPFWLLLYTANLELFVWALTMAAVWAFFSEQKATAAALFGIAIACKTVPILYLLLFLRRRDWRLLPLALGVAAAVTVASLFVVYPDIARSWREMREGMAFFVQRDGLGYLRGQIGFDHSLWAALKAILPGTTPDARAPLLTAYLCGCAVAVLALWVARVRHLGRIEQILFLSVASVLLPPTSYDYTLVNLYAPLVLLIVWLASQQAVPGSVAVALGCFAVILAFDPGLYLHGVRFTAQVRALFLLILLIDSAYGFAPAPVSKAVARPQLP